MSENNPDDNIQENSPSEPNQPPLAIDYSPNQVPPPRQPRQPSNLQDLLRYAVEAGSRGGGQSSVDASRAAPMNEANRGFLLNALNSMMVNVSEELANIIKTLKENHTQKYMCIDALDNLSDYVCSIDYANDFLKMGGLDALKLLLESAEDELRWRAAEMIADIVQNNPFSQKFVIETDLLSLLLSNIEDDLCLNVKVKSLYAVSCLIRDNDQCLKEFTKKDGFSVLLRCIQSKNEKLVIKSSFLMACLCTDNPEVKQVLISMGLVEQLCMLIDIDDAFDSETNEHILSALSTLIKSCPHAQELCRQEPLNLKLKLSYMKEQHAGNEVYHKELEYANVIIKEVFEDEATDDDHEDR